MDFLMEALKGGPVLGEEVKSLAASEGVSEGTLLRAKKHLSVKSFKPHGTKHWFWNFPPKFNSDVIDEPQQSECEF